MINMDMVGRLTDNKLIVYGTDTATEFEGLVERLGKQVGFDIARKHGGFGPSDHSSFYAKQIPVMHFFTGSHPDYHRPTDDFPKLNVDGMRRVADLVAEVAVAIDVASDPPHFRNRRNGPSAMAATALLRQHSRLFQWRDGLCTLGRHKGESGRPRRP